MSSAPTDCRVPDPTDAKADGQFQQVNRRAGYGDDRLDRIIATARKGWTLAAGEGLALVQEIDRLRKELEIATSMLSEQVPLLNRLQDENDWLRERLTVVETDAKRYVYLRSLLRHYKWRDVDPIHELAHEFEKYITDDDLDVALDEQITYEEREVAGE